MPATTQVKCCEAQHVTLRKGHNLLTKAEAHMDWSMV